MKQVVIGFLALINICYAQVTCCSKIKATEDFALLIYNKGFVSAHEEPLPFKLQTQTGKEISYETPDGKKGYAYEISSNSNNVLFVIHEWWGLNDYIKQEAEKIAKETGYKVIALDLYDKKVASVKDSASKYMQETKTERAQAIIKGAINYVGTKADIATIGWCFGGGWSLQVSLLAGKQAKACVMYYGMPEENLSQLKKLNSPVLFVFAEKDQWINKEVVAKFEKNMKFAGKSLKVKAYNANHAFANPSNPNFDKSFSEDAYKNAIDFFKEHLH